MNVVITGASGGIGAACVRRFLQGGHTVWGIDVAPAPFACPGYTHFVADISRDALPPLDDVHVLVNNAGVQNSGRDIEVNLQGTMRVTRAYALHPGIRSVVFVASASAHTGAEFPAYAASKGGMVTYMKHVALEIAKWGGTANSISPGGVTTPLNKPVMDDPQKWARIMELTPLKKWADADEIAEWIYFVGAVNRSMTAQDVLIDNGESANACFVW